MLAVRCRVRACVFDGQTRRGLCSEGFLADYSSLELALLEGSVCLVVVHVVFLVTLAHIWRMDDSGVTQTARQYLRLLSSAGAWAWTGLGIEGNHPCMHDARRHAYGVGPYPAVFFLPPSSGDLHMRVPIDKSSTACPPCCSRPIECSCSPAHPSQSPRAVYVLCALCARDLARRRINDMLKTPAIGGLSCRRRWRLLCTNEK